MKGVGKLVIGVRDYSWAFPPPPFPVNETLLCVDFPLVVVVVVVVCVLLFLAEVASAWIYLTT